MKVTDYCPRAAPFDSCLTRRNLVGMEIGVDVGAHAHAMLAHCDLSHLYLVDPWEKDYFRGYCEGRLHAAGYKHRVTLLKTTSLKAVDLFLDAPGFDFVYIDQHHEADIVAHDLAAWWPRLASDGVLGYRNYTGKGTPLDRAVDAFVAKHRIRAKPAQGEIILFGADACIPAWL